MRNFPPIFNVAGLFLRDGTFLGSSFIFRQPNKLLTAAHCVHEKSPEQIYARLVGTQKIYEVSGITRHPNPSIDVAVVTLDGVDEVEIGFPAHALFDDVEMGLEVATCGLPDLVSREEEPVPRVIRGHVQRYVTCQARGNAWIEVELSFRCPKGLSGGPVYNGAHHGRNYGLVVGEREASQLLDTIDDIDDDGKRYRETRHSVIYYGRAVWLPSIAAWIDSQVPALTSEEMHRRSELQSALETAARG